jgi:hypothetical protein
MQKNLFIIQVMLKELTGRLKETHHWLLESHSLFQLVDGEQGRLHNIKKI